MLRVTATAALPFVFACAFAQQEPPAPPSAPPQAPTPAPTPTRPQPQQRPRAPVPNVAIGDVNQYRDGQTAAVTRACQLFQLDLSGVDLKADPLLVVDDKPITRADLDREICLMLGATQIEQFITGVLLDHVREELAAKGQPVPAITITEEDVKKKFEQDLTVIPQMRGMKPEEYERQVKEVFGWARYVEFQKRQMEFESFFFPEPAKEWYAEQEKKAKQLDAEHAKQVEAKVQQLVEEAQKNGAPPPSADAIKKLQAEPGPVPDGDLSFIPAITWELLDAASAASGRPGFSPAIRDSLLRGNALIPIMKGGVVGQIRKTLLDRVPVRSARPDEPEVAVFCDGKPFLLKDLLALLAPNLDDHAQRLALLELATLRACDARLAGEHALLSDADAEAGYQAWRKEYTGTIIPPEQAVLAYGFNSVWHFREYFQRKFAYERWLTASLTPEKIAQHYENAGRLFFESGSCISHLLFLPATGATKGEVKAQMEAQLAEVAAGKPFATVARESGKFPDGKEIHGGALSPLVCGRMRQALRETLYTTFLAGHSFADEAFYSAREENLVGPIWRDLEPELTGWYVMQVDRFFTTGSKPALDDKTRERAIDDLVNITFPRFCNEALAGCRIELGGGKQGG